MANHTPVAELHIVSALSGPAVISTTDYQTRNTETKPIDPHSTRLSAKNDIETVKCFTNLRVLGTLCTLY